MSDEPLRSALRLREAHDRALIKDDEFVENLMDDFAYSPHVDPSLVAEIYHAVPGSAFRLFVLKLEESLTPGFEWRAFLGKQMTESEVNAERKLNGIRIAMWAKQLLEFHALLTSKVAEQ